MFLLYHLDKLAKYYELVVYTILPKVILEQVYDKIPGIRDLISHSLCYEDLIYDGDYACKDLGYLAQNRTINIVPGDDEDMTISEIMVSDIGLGSTSSDQETVTYLQG
jgi:hypothetical protein